MKAKTREQLQAEAATLEEEIAEAEAMYSKAMVVHFRAKTDAAIAARKARDAVAAAARQAKGDAVVASRWVAKASRELRLINAVLESMDAPQSVEENG